MVLLLTEHHDIIETQTRNCLRSQIVHAAALMWLLYVGETQHLLSQRDL